MLGTQKAERSKRRKEDLTTVIKSFPSLRGHPVFLALVSPAKRKERRSDDRKYICGSQANLLFHPHSTTHTIARLAPAGTEAIAGSRSTFAYFAVNSARWRPIEYLLLVESSRNC